jgi:1-aminocyclopropane-1-carboxylate deaminase/D-cysteine desulfhydrase-like pyridoxal-dependent ACC family enzyme
MNGDWSTWLDETPAANIDGRWYKREDLFAPLGPQGVNGSKLRQLIYLIGTAVENGATEIVTAASVRSPQLSMTAIVGAAFGLPVHIILGATKPETSMKYPNVRIAALADAVFHYVKVGYNPFLQARAREMRDARPGSYLVNYGITTEGAATPEEVEAFHKVGATQTLNLPDVETLVLPCGSANTTVSVLYGLNCLRPLGNLKKVVLVGIGPNREEWVSNRLKAIGTVVGEELTNPFELELFDLHSSGVVRYEEVVPWSADGIVFHPTYEGKVMRWLDSPEGRQAVPGWQQRNNSTCVWIVGSAPNPEAMESALFA